MSRTTYASDTFPTSSRTATTVERTAHVTGRLKPNSSLLHNSSENGELVVLELKLRPSDTTTATATLLPSEISTGSSTENHVRWSSDTFDNELLNRKKSKICCIYHKPRLFGESSSSDESSDSDRNHFSKKYRSKPKTSCSHDHTNNSI